ncbi:hypothetical protein E2562_008794 [Oryza meyeriana var. granulata]|uniref:Uncharacterized protein n=1 Tax=Oryza meyeriana var. granulata TaxID=110450 RepID=A0A6G1CZW4_9ORYZ|nr:hypothetical protein E2562_008794 [Oryza meyeriana var. granulata]
MASAIPCHIESSAPGDAHGGVEPATYKIRRRGIVASWPDPWMLTCLWNDHQLPNDSFEPFLLFDSPELLEETVPRRRRRWRAMPRDACGHGSALVLGGYKKKQHGAGAVHSPSSQFRWKHR